MAAIEALIREEFEEYLKTLHRRRPTNEFRGYLDDFQKETSPSGSEVLPKERYNFRHYGCGICPPKAVVASSDFRKLNGDPMIFKSLRKRSRLANRHQPVLVAMLDEKRWASGGYMKEW